MLFRDLKDLQFKFDNKPFICQRYLDKPLLLDGYKFDLRVYVLVVGHENMQAFVCDEGLARFCTAKYEAPNKTNYKKSYMHLTNYSINKMSEDYVQATSGGQDLRDEDASKRTLSSLFETLVK
mmetsp:Transcript_6295/g.4497  ORF Transcript_6295/g.4497 Transcript_6295/m.4497 type:complete len:123 (+) Transcript_6295:422-790(+)